MKKKNIRNWTKSKGFGKCVTQSSGKSVHTPTKYENNGRVINEATVAKKAFTGISWYRLHTPACNSLIQVEYQNRKLFSL